MSESKTHLGFHLNEEPFAIPVDRVEEVIEYAGPTLIPRAPEYLLGVVNIRGRLIPIMDLRRRFDLGPAMITATSRFIVLNLSWDGEIVSLGALVDSVSGVLDLDEETISPPPTLGGRSSDFLRGTVRYDDKIYMVLEVDSILPADTLREDFAALSRV